MLYRILTEDKNYTKIIEIIDQHFTGYTMYQAKGVYCSTVESSLVIEIDTNNGLDRSYERAIKDIAQQIKKLNDQECVLVQKINCESEFV